VIAVIPDASISMSNQAKIPESTVTTGNQQIAAVRPKLTATKGNKQIAAVRCYINMPITWLRIRHCSVIGPMVSAVPMLSWFAKGAYVSSLYFSGLENDSTPRAWKIVVSGLCSHANVRLPTVLNVFQAPDSESPTAPPDVFKDKVGGHKNRAVNIAAKIQV
jgi:hypothetical protein